MKISDIIIMLEVYWLALFCVPLPVLCAGNISGITVSAVLILLTFFRNYLFILLNGIYSSGLMGKIVIFICLTAAILVIAYLIILSVKMRAAASDRPSADVPCTVIVLGCRVKDGKPTRMLRKRLDAALEYLRLNESGVCILSGGKGKDEIVSESAAMKEYMISKGFDEKRIYTEDMSATTAENLRFSLDIIKNRKLPFSAALATDGFHQYRAAMLAKRIGLNVKAISSSTEPRYAPTYWVREWIAITAYYFKK